jgi:hypothetical protein
MHKLHRKEVAMQVVRHAAREATGHALTVDPPDGRDAAAPMDAQGAIPIPYRCLDRAQAAALRRFAQARSGT